MTKKRSTTVRCNVKFEGIHCFPEAPNEVSYLRNPHRHIFSVEVEMDVFHNDREVEFIMLGHKVNERISKFSCDQNNVVQLGSASCEDVATSVLDYLSNVIPRSEEREMVVTVMEDGENGATVYSLH